MCLFDCWFVLIIQSTVSWDVVWKVWGVEIIALNKIIEQNLNKIYSFTRHNIQFDWKYFLSELKLAYANWIFTNTLLINSSKWESMTVTFFFLFYVLNNFDKSFKCCIKTVVTKSLFMCVCEWAIGIFLFQAFSLYGCDGYFFFALVLLFFYDW